MLLNIKRFTLLSIVLLFLGCSDVSTGTIETTIEKYLLSVNTMPFSFCGNSLMGGKAKEIKSVEIEKQSEIKERGNIRFLVVKARVEGTCTTNMPAFYQQKTAKVRDFKGVGEFIVYEDDYGDWQAKGK